MKIKTVFEIEKEGMDHYRGQDFVSDVIDHQCEKLGKDILKPFIFESSHQPNPEAKRFYGEFVILSLDQAQDILLIAKAYNDYWAKVTEGILMQPIKGINVITDESKSMHLRTVQAHKEQAQEPEGQSPDQTLVE